MMAASNRALPAPVPTAQENTQAPNQSVLKAALWLASTPVAEVPRPLVPHLRRKFDLSALNAVDVIRRAETMRREVRK